MCNQVDNIEDTCNCEVVRQASEQAKQRALAYLRSLIKNGETVENGENGENGETR